MENIMTTRKDIEKKVTQLNEMLNRPSEYYTDGHSNPGHIMVDLSRCYGGYQLQVVSNNGGVDDRIFGLPGWHRYTAQKMDSFLSGLIAGLEVNHD